MHAGAIGERGARVVGDLAGDHRDVRHAEIGGPREHAAHDLAFEARRVELALAGDDERRAVERGLEADGFGDRVETGHELRADRGEPAREPARRAAAR